MPKPSKPDSILPSIDLRREAKHVKPTCWHMQISTLQLATNWSRCFDKIKTSFKSNHAFKKRGYTVFRQLRQKIDYSGMIQFGGRGYCSAKAQMDRSTGSAGYGGNTQQDQPGFAGPSMYQPNTGSPPNNFTQYAEPELPGPTMYQANAVRGTVWSSGLFDCHEDETNAVMTAFLPCVTFGQIAEVMDQGEMTCPLGSLIYALMMPALCSQWVMGSSYRKRLRERYNLVEAPYTDIISHVFCPCCSLCQEFRELRKRGLDPSLGWNGILAQRQAAQHETVEVPPPRQTMF